jgi:hypothetical protein
LSWTLFSLAAVHPGLSEERRIADGASYAVQAHSSVVLVAR